MMSCLKRVPHGSSLKELHMRLLTHVAVVVATALTLTACSAASAPVDTTADEAALKAATNAWIDAFSLADVMLFRPLPVNDPGRVVTVATFAAGDRFAGRVSYPKYRQLPFNRSRSTG
jgi:hypothetical protein